MNMWLALLNFSIGIIVGIAASKLLTWWQINRAYRRNPSIKALVDAVIAQREARERKR